MLSVLTSWALYTTAMAIVAGLLSGFEVKGGLKGILAVAALFGILNWALAGLVGAVFTVLTLGLALILSFLTHAFVTALLLKLTAVLSDRLKLRSFWTALAAGVLMTILVALAEKFVLPSVGLS